jgi:hypothetical protein
VQKVLLQETTFLGWTRIEVTMVQQVFLLFFNYFIELYHKLCYDTHTVHYNTQDLHYNILMTYEFAGNA